MLTQGELRKLGAGRWVVPLIALLHERDGARFAELRAGLAAARDPLVRTLDLAADAGWVMRNRGYGHPLRPEYVLTPPGRTVGPTCRRLMAARLQLGLPPESLPRWSLPLIGLIGAERRRFSELLDALAPVTPRALSMTVKPMMDGDLLQRDVQDRFPPTVCYRLATSGLALFGYL